MLEEKLNLKKTLKLFFVILICDYFSVAHALSTDREQPIEVEANYAELDDLKGITIYKGNVIITQGSIKVSGDIMTATYNDDGELDTMIIEGKPAHYEQLPDNNKTKDVAEALRMEFYSLKNYIVLIHKALMQQQDLRFTGDRIEYNTETSKIIAKGNTNTGQQKNDADKQEPTGRVKIILKQKKSD